MNGPSNNNDPTRTISSRGHPSNSARRVSFKTGGVEIGIESTSNVTVEGSVSGPESVEIIVVNSVELEADLEGKSSQHMS